MARAEHKVRIGDTELKYSELSKILQAQGIFLTDRKFSKKFLSYFRFQSSVVVDVGIRTGTPELYKTFPAAEFLLFEPDPDCEQKFRDRFTNLTFRYFNFALGASEGTLTLRRQGGASTLGTPLGGLADARFEGLLEVPIRRLDTVLDELGIKGPFGLKIDTEGFEYPVLVGAGDRLADAEFVIAELDILPRFKESVEFSKVLALLAKAGLEFVSVLNERPGIQRFYDCLFVRKTHPIFSHRN